MFTKAKNKFRLTCSLFHRFVISRLPTFNRFAVFRLVGELPFHLFPPFRLFRRFTVVVPLHNFAVSSTHRFIAGRFTRCRLFNRLPPPHPNSAR